MTRKKFGQNRKTGKQQCPARAGHGRPWLAMAGHGWPWLVMAGHGWPCRLPMGWPWPAMAGYGQASLVMSGQLPVNGQPRTQRSRTWQRLALRSCFWPRKLQFASGSNPSAKSQTQDPKPKLPKQNSQTPQLRVQRNPKHNSQTQDLKPQIPNRCYSKLLVRVTLG